MQSQHEAIKIQEELDRLLKLSKHKGAMEGDARCPSAIPKNVCTGHLQADKCSFFQLPRLLWFVRNWTKGSAMPGSVQNPHLGFWILDLALEAMVLW